MSVRPTQDDFILVTGATGFVGHYVLRDLLSHGQRCVALVRGPVAQATTRLHALLVDLGCDVDQMLAERRLVIAEGNLVDMHYAPTVRIGAVVHVAASTRFDADATGEPHRSNVDGTVRLLSWMTAYRVPKLFLVSSAYQCGRTDGIAPELLGDADGDFHNTYEKTKRQAERIALEWSLGGGRTTTIFRPSIIVGDTDTGRATRFTGFYFMPRAIEALRTLAGRDASIDPMRLNIRLPGRGDGHQNIVPVDYVARMIAYVVMHPEHAGSIYHLTHPAPPTNDTIKHAVEQHFGVAGGQWVGPEHLADQPLNRFERTFYDLSRSIEHYFIDTPRFSRLNTMDVEHASGIRCPMYDHDTLIALFAAGEKARWRWSPRKQAASSVDEPSCATYFERFLPEHVPQSRIASMTALTTTIRFDIEDEPDGQWACRFVEGNLREVHRGSNHLAEDFTYRTTRRVFQRAIAGLERPQDLFLRGDATIVGDVEAGLKMAMILHAFTCEFPCTDLTTADGRRRSCRAS